MRRKRVKLRSLGERIKWLRQNQEIHSVYHEKDYFASGSECGERYTQERLAELLDVSLDTVKNWEQGYNYPPIDTLVELSEIFDCDFDFLLGKQDIPKKYTGLSEKAASEWLNACKSNDPVCSLVSDLLEEKEVLQGIQNLVISDYARFSVITKQDAFRLGSICVGRKEMMNSDIMELFKSLMTFINKKRAGKHLDKLL